MKAWPLGREPAPDDGARHSFALSPGGFLLDGRDLQLRSGELHPSRIPPERWRHRLKAVKALGLNTVACYAFWNRHETAPGSFDFETRDRRLSAFFELAREEGLWVFLRPGPYVCAEWDNGGIPSRLNPLLRGRLRSSEPAFLEAAGSWIRAIASVARPYLVTRGGPILMVQAENEYGSFGTDRDYLAWILETWREAGIDVPFCTADGPTPRHLAAGSLAGLATGLDAGLSEGHWDLAKAFNPGSPVFSAETYPGWLTHWGERWAKGKDLTKTIDFYMGTRKSFSLYVVHGGTNFGLTAGANTGPVNPLFPGAEGAFMPDITSYDYGAPVGEQGKLAPHYAKIRAAIARGLEAAPPEAPEAPPVMAPPEVVLERRGSILDLARVARYFANPRSFEELGQNQGLMLYRCRLPDGRAGRLRFRGLHDRAIVMLEGRVLATLDRRKRQESVRVPADPAWKPGAEGRVVEVLVEAMGHVNFGAAMGDLKGLTGPVTFDWLILHGWEQLPLPLDGPCPFPASGRGIKAGGAAAVPSTVPSTGAAWQAPRLRPGRAASSREASSSTANRKIPSSTSQAGARAMPG